VTKANSSVQPMNFQIFSPPAHLKDFVRCFWVLESSPDSPMPPKEYQSMADGFGELIFQYKGGFEGFEKSPVYFRAPKTSVQQLILSNEVEMMGVRLYPHTIPEILHIPASELCNAAHDVRHILNAQDSALALQVLTATSTREKIYFVSSLMSRLVTRRKADPMSQFVKLIIQRDGQVSIKDMLTRSGYSERQFERRFTSLSGFTPKQFVRILRYQSTKRKYASGNYKTLAELAQDSGYFDQSHFIREFKEFSGFDPKRYFNLINDTASEEGRIIKNLILAKDQPDFSNNPKREGISYSR
jgi:AraC-like DNA-binding protein